MLLKHLDPRSFTPRARMTGMPRLSPDALAMFGARRLHRGAHLLRCSNFTGTWGEVMYVNMADFSAVASTASETSLLGGVNDLPLIPATFWQNKLGRGRAIRILARGVLSTTSTPTIVFQVRLGTTGGSSFLSGTSVGVSATITTASGVTNQWWELLLELTCYTPGIGAGNTTLSGSGYVKSPGGFASPFEYALEPTTPPTATWTATVDNSVIQFPNVSITWGTSSASNTATCKQLFLYGLN